MGIGGSRTVRAENGEWGLEMRVEIERSPRDKGFALAAS